MSTPAHTQNGTGPEAGTTLGAHPEAIKRALGQRIEKLRGDVAATEENLDTLHAAYLTEQHMRLELQAENSRLLGLLAKYDIDPAGSAEPGSEPAGGVSTNEPRESAG